MIKCNHQIIKPIFNTTPSYAKDKKRLAGNYYITVIKSHLECP